MKPCFKCQSGCCRTNDIPLTGYDVMQVMSILKLHPAAFVDFVEITTDEENLLNEPLIHFAKKENPHVMRLKKIQSKEEPAVKKCYFLAEWKDLKGKLNARCGIYSLMPLYCTTWPAEFDENGLFIEYKDVVATAPPVSHELYRLCPRNFTPEDDTHGIVDTLVYQDHEKAFYKNFVEMWNETPTDMNTFFKCLYNLYTKRAIFQEEVGDIES